LVIDVKSSSAEFSEEEKTAIHAQMERLLSNSFFSHSRRFPSFLRYVIGATISGQQDVLKERTLGVEIFGKSADYDTSSDPIVRVTAAEIRKRIAQYYQLPGHEDEIRISLPPGSYIPQFHWPQKQKDEVTLTVNVVPVVTEQPGEHALVSLRDRSADQPGEPAPDYLKNHSAQRWRNAFFALCGVLIVAMAAGVAFWNSAQRTAFDFFWGPVMNTSDPVLFCIADQSQYAAISLRAAADPSHQTVLQDNLTAVVIDDITPVVRLAGALQANGKKYTLRGENATTLRDLRAGPTVFIGAFDNAWTLRQTNSLYYHFANNADMTQFHIVQGRSQAETRWTVERSQQMATNNYSDYAIVARFTDAVTGRISVIAAGIGRGGTIAAGEFLTNPADLAQLERAAKAAGNKKNMEFVLSTQIIDGEPGTPVMEASYFW
jgi:hypothetical protein